MSTSNDEDLTDFMNENRDGWCQAMGLYFTHVTRTKVSARIEITSTHHQPYGIVHGGVYAGMVETTASVGAGIAALAEGRSAVGLDNHTSFLHATREGTLHATAEPLTRGNKTQLWRCNITDDTGRVVATGTVRLILLDPR